jgi:hypothetical protein
MTFNQYFRSMTIICYALIAGQITFFLAICFILTSGGEFLPNAGITEILLVVNIAVAAIGLFGSNFFSKKSLDIAKNKTSLLDKLAKYKETLIIKYAFYEGPSFLGLIFIMLTGEYYFGVFPALFIYLILKNRPQKETLISELELNMEELNLANRPDAIIK